MLKTFLIAWPFCFLFVDFLVWRELKGLRLERVRARILDGLAYSSAGASRQGRGFDREGL
jgi:hypothetical protein